VVTEIPDNGVLEIRAGPNPPERFPKSSVAPRVRVKPALEARVTVSTGVEKKMKCCPLLKKGSLRV
jgi:hypothetical protein